MSRSDNVDDYVVVDPLLEAGKAKFNRQQQRAKKRENEWWAGFFYCRLSFLSDSCSF